MFTKEYDPTTLRTDTPCKLVRFLVEDGAHVQAGGSYAEVEVMKMYMPLITKESGMLPLSCKPTQEYKTLLRCTNYLLLSPQALSIMWQAREPFLLQGM